ncbi:hypothetical protein [Brevundimonas sp.]|uniref:hypothetical protein n=1 Tax=Brevundimonas sp. TaxID=1871086 RepID=UPI00258B8C1F|nr:hypothetical protein [Brevundimonas sp.]
MDQALDAICEVSKVEGVAEAEKMARAAGVIARAARAVAALEPLIAADSEEDEMGGRIYDPEEDERLRRELAAHCDRLDEIIEAKRDRRAGGGAAEAGASQGAGQRAPNRSGPE